MRVLVLGPGGQLGSDLLRTHAAEPEGLELIPVGRDRLDVDRPDTIANGLEGERFDALVNCTGYNRTDEAEANASRAFSANAFAVLEMARLCRARASRFLHVSTDYVFGGELRRPYRESDAPRPLNVYGASKLTGEALAFREHSDTVVLRVASLFGVAGSSKPGGNFVEVVLRAGREQGKLRVVSDITMSPTATADVARWIFAVLQAEVPAGTYHAVNTGSATWHEFAVEILRQAGVAAEVTPVTSAEYPAAAIRPTYSVLDNGLLAGIVGPIPPWQDALARYLRAKEERSSDPVPRHEAGGSI